MGAGSAAWGSNAVSEEGNALHVSETQRGCDDVTCRATASLT